MSIQESEPRLLVKYLTIDDATEPTIDSRSIVIVSGTVAVNQWSPDFSSSDEKLMIRMLREIRLYWR